MITTLAATLGEYPNLLMFLCAVFVMTVAVWGMWR
jgi:hypothetical protein